MSDTETTDTIDTTDITEQEHPSVSTICDYFHSAIQETRESNDYISYATLLDYYLANPSIYTDGEKTQLLSTLYDILAENNDLLEEIGWDLPELILNFYDNEFDYKGSLLSDTDLIKLIMKIFELLAKFGNSKELFLKSTELIGSLKIDKKNIENNYENDESRNAKIIDIKLHTLIELMSTCLKRINTIYPSRFLSMAITSLLKISQHYFDNYLHHRFIIRRTYSFARDYISPLKPLDYLEIHNITQQEANKIEDDENYLQRKLLTSFLTQITEMAFKNNCVDLSSELFKSLQFKNNGILPPANETDEELFTSSRGLFSRITQLSLSFDMDLESLFENIKNDSITLFSKIDPKKSNDDKIQDLLKFSLNDKISYMFHPDSKTIPINQPGLLILCAQYTKETSKLLPIKIHEAIAITIRFLSPVLLTSKFQALGNLDVVIFWCWTSIINSSIEDFNKIPHYQLILFLQFLIFFSSTVEKSNLRVVIFTLLTRMLSTIDEKTSYEFIIDTLTTAPYPNAKAAMISILKDLILRVKPSINDINQLTDQLKDSKLNESEKEHKAPPKLPERHYIELNNNRIDDIYTLIRESIDETFISINNDSKLSINESNFKILLGYLNFLIGIKARFPLEKRNIIITKIDENMKKLDPKGEKSGLNDGVNVDFIKLAIDSLKK